MVAPHFTMLWDARHPAAAFTDAAGRPTEVTVVAGRARRSARRPRRRRDSWASQRGQRRRDLDDQDGAGRALDAAAGRAGHEPRRSTSFRAAACASPDATIPPSHESSCAPTAALALEAGRDRERAPAAAGPPDRRAGGAVRPVRDEHARARSSRRSTTTSAPSSAAGRGPATSRSTRATRDASREGPTARPNARRRRSIPFPCLQGEGTGAVSAASTGALRACRRWRSRSRRPPHAPESPARSPTPASSRRWP